MKLSDIRDTIVALSTPSGQGAIGLIRISGTSALSIANQFFKGIDLSRTKSHTAHFGRIMKDGSILDEVVMTVFKSPHSYTGEDIVEISCHGSAYIIRSVIQLIMKHGARLAKHGEFTQRAFLNGRLDLPQAEAVADLIAAENEASHTAAMNQMRGGFSNEIKTLRRQLVHFASMIELELDFSEEDVEFAGREELKALVEKIMTVVADLMRGFELGNALKSGIPVVIAGKPNAGKSTLLNALLNEEKAIVSDIPGTTRDVIEDTLNIRGFPFRFIDTAGLRKTDSTIESIGVDRTKDRMRKAAVILYMIDMSIDSISETDRQITSLKTYDKPYCLIGNKTDIAGEEMKRHMKEKGALMISAKNKENLEALKSKLPELSGAWQAAGVGSIIVTDMRHFESLRLTREALERVVAGVDAQITNDILALDIREALHHLGEITGEITTEDLLDNIFGKFCIGK